MAATAVSFRAPVLAWAIAPDDEARFQSILQRVLVAAVILCLAMLFMPPPKVDRSQPPELPPRLTRLLLEREQTPLPPPVQKIEKAKEKADSQVAADKAQPAKPEPNKVEPVRKAAAVPEARNPQPNQPPGEIDAARRKAAGVGLLAMKDQLAELRGAPVAVQIKPDIQQGPGVGASVGAGVGAGTEAGLPSRALITSNAAGGSGGINTAGYSRNTGGGGLAGRATTLVEGVAGGGGGGGLGGAGTGKGRSGAEAGGAVGSATQRAAGGKASRSIESIRLVFERNKGAIYAIYNRALREDPGLQGKVVLELKIAPSGEVLDCRVVSSELHAAELERKLLVRIKQFDFGAQEVEPKIVTWPVDFLPS